MCTLALLTGPRAAIAAPTDTGDGTYYYAHLDLRFWDDPDVRFTRTYNSVDTRPGPLSPGWTHSFDVRLFHEAEARQDVVKVIGAYTKTATFTPLPDGRFKAQKPEAGTLVRHQEGPFKDTYELVGPGGTRFELDPDGRAFQITYPNKTTVAIEYDQANRLETVVTRDGSRRLTFSYQADTDRLVAVKDWLDPARELRFGYDERGRLASFADRLGAVTHCESTRYAYDPQGNVARTTKTGPDGVDTQVVEYVHDGAGRLRRVVEHQGTAGTSKSVTTKLFYRQYTLTSICQTP